jgi:hypothetical protein
MIFPRTFRLAIAATCAFALHAGIAAELDAEADIDDNDRETNNIYQYEISGGLSYSDNVGQTKNDKVWEIGLDAGVKGNIAYDHRRVNANLGADLQFRTHGKLGFNDELMGGLAGLFDYNLINERVHWIVQNNLGQSLINSQNRGTPDNTQNINYFSTGPEITFPFGPRTAIALLGRWSDVAYMKSNEDTRHLEGSLAIQRQIGQHTQLSLNGKKERITYKSLPSTLDYDVQSAYVRWSGVGSKTTLNINGGITELKERAVTTREPLYGLELTRQLSSRTQVRLTTGREFDDAADALRRQQVIKGPNLGSQAVNVTEDPFRSDYAAAAWSFKGGRSTFEISGDWRREAHVRIVALDTEARGGGLRVSREITPRMTVDFNSEFQQEVFRVSGVKFDEWSTGLQLGWSITPAYAMTAQLVHYVGNGDTLLGPNTRDFTENRLTVLLHWSPHRLPDGQRDN